MNTSNSFGEGASKKFEVGDIVSWKELGGKRNMGMLYEIYNATLGGRQVKKGKVASWKDTHHHEVLLLELKLIYKGDK